MKKFLLGTILLVLCSTSMFAQSAKNALQISSLSLVSATSNTGGWQPILGNINMFGANAVRIHTSQQKDLIIGASFECGVYTQTLVKSKNGVTDTSSAEATVQIRVRVDPGTSAERITYPGDVTFCNRYQHLSAKLQGILQLVCVDSNGDGNLDQCDLNVIDDESIEFVLRTLNANAFFYALDDLGAGTHNIVVEARITSNTNFQNGTATASALIGKGAVTVEEVRLLKSGDFNIP